jgi:hypothetical protein
MHVPRAALRQARKDRLSGLCGAETEYQRKGSGYDKKLSPAECDAPSVQLLPAYAFGVPAAVASTHELCVYDHSGYHP